LQARGVLPKRGERPARSELAHPAQQATHRRQLEAAEEKRTADLATSQAAAGETALALWNRAKPASTHPYLAAKQIPPGSLRRHNDQLLVPITDGKKLVNLQRIHPNGNKRFLKGARIKACYTPVGEVGDTFYIAEGYATAATVQRLTGKAVFAAFTATNLLSVAQTLRARYPRAEIILAADNDHHTPGNPGLTQASRAAAAIGAGLVWPKFPSDHPGSDFNDKCLMAEASAS
jgi:putative DNA primase/helicase